MEYFEDDREIDSKDAAIVFREDGTLDILIPKIDENDTETDVANNVLVATALGGLLSHSDQIKELIMYEIDQMLSKYPTMKTN